MRNALGEVLRQRRKEAGFSRARLAEVAGVSAATIRNIETGRHAPSRAIVRRLQAVPALNLPMLIEEQLPDPAQHPEAAFQGHCWVAPDFDAVEQSRELSRVLNGHGGRLDPTLLFLDPMSAAAWCSLSSTEASSRERASMPLAAVAATIASSLSTSSLDVIGLGSAEALAETSLVQELLGLAPLKLRLLLLDSSPSLLVAGFRHASATVVGVEAASVFAIQGDLRNLPIYSPLFLRRHRRLVCLFGDTFGTLDNEATFIKHSLGSFCGGDLLLLDVPLALPVPADEPHLRPGALVGPDAPEQFIDFLTRPLYSHCAGLRSIELSAVLDRSACVIPGSYAVEYQAFVQVAEQAPRRFSLYHVKRYDLDRLVESLARIGWLAVERWPFGDARSPRALLLLQKRV